MTEDSGACATTATGTAALDVSAYRRVLGDELRRERTGRGWTRKQLRRRLPDDISLQTLATYELGTRDCSVIRFAELCVAMEVAPETVLARVHERVVDADRPGVVSVSVGKIIADSRPELEPLRRWARERVGSVRGERVALDLAALESLSTLCGMDTVALIAALREGRNGG